VRTCRRRSRAGPAKFAEQTATASTGIASGNTGQADHSRHRDVDNADSPDDASRSRNSNRASFDTTNDANNTTVDANNTTVDTNNATVDTNNATVNTNNATDTNRATIDTASGADNATVANAR
jgi:hypothetical protein